MAEDPDIHQATLAGLALETKAQAHKLITNPRQTRAVPSETPADFDLPFENVSCGCSLLVAPFIGVIGAGLLAPLSAGMRE